MTEEETIPEKKFTELLDVAAFDEIFQMTTCIECGTTLIITERDRKSGVHPMAIHIEWHENLVVWFEKVDAMVDSIEELVRLISGATPLTAVENLNVAPPEPVLSEEKPKPFPAQQGARRPGPRPPRTDG